MAEVTIISAGAALVGSGAWFAAKLFGPSAEALGDQLKAYFTRRIESIFAAAGRLAADRGLEIAPVPAGLLARMIARMLLFPTNPMTLQTGGPTCLSMLHCAPRTSTRCSPISWHSWDPLKLNVLMRY